MSTFYTKLVTGSVLVLIIVPLVVMASNQWVPVRVEITDQEEIEKYVVKPSWWESLRERLGARAPTIIKPPAGTQFTFTLTAYASSPYQTDSTPCITAAGTRVRPGVVATNIFPKGTLLKVEGFVQTFIVEDRMNTRYNGYFLDMWMPSTSEALALGRTKKKITVVGYGEPGQALPAAEADTLVDNQAEPTIWRASWRSLTQFLKAQVSSDVNQYDVDCSQAA